VQPPRATHHRVGHKHGAPVNFLLCPVELGVKQDEFVEPRLKRANASHRLSKVQLHLTFDDVRSYKGLALVQLKDRQPLTQVQDTFAYHATFSQHDEVGHSQFVNVADLNFFFVVSVGVLVDANVLCKFFVTVDGGSSAWKRLQVDVAPHVFILNPRQCSNPLFTFNGSR